MSPPSPWPTGRSRSVAARHRREHGLHVRDGGAAELEPAGVHQRVQEEQAGGELRDRSTSTSAASSRRARRTRRPARRSARGRGTPPRPRRGRPRRSPPRRTACSATPSRLEALDRPRVELVVGVDAEVLAAAVERERAPIPGRRLVATSARRRGRGTMRWVGKISSPGERDETSTAKVCVARRVLLAEGDRGLVAVVAVGDQQRHVELELVRAAAARRACARRPPRRPCRARASGRSSGGSAS